VTLDHPLDQGIDFLFPISEVTTFNIMASLVSPSSTWIAELEVPQESVYSLEGWSYGENLVNDIFETDDSLVLATQVTSDGLICYQGDTTSIDFEKTSLVDESANGFKVRVSPGDVGLGNAKHIQSSLVQFDKCGIVDLAKSEQLENFPWFWGNSIDTTNSYDKGQLRLRWNIEVVMLAGHAMILDDSLLASFIFFFIFASPIDVLRTKNPSLFGLDGCQESNLPTFALPALHRSQHIFGKRSEGLAIRFVSLLGQSSDLSWLRGLLCSLCWSLCVRHDQFSAKS